MQKRVVQDYNWCIAQLPFKQSIGHALKDRSTTQSIIFRVVDETGITGYGEGAPRSYVAKESIENVGEELEKLLTTYPIPRCDAWQQIKRYSQLLLQDTKYPSTVCAIETALLDLFGKQTNRHITEFLPVSSPKSPVYSMVIPFMSVSQAKQYVAYATQLAVPHLKIKVGFENDIEFVQQLLLEVPLYMEVRLDANQAWDFTEAVEKCQAFEALGIRYIEAPLNIAEIERLPELSQAVDVLIGLDESLYTLRHAQFYRQNMKEGSVYFNLKLSKCGGYFSTHEIWRFAQANGIPCQLGCNVGETAILSALGRAFAEQHTLLFTEGSFNNLLLKKDLTTDKLSFGQHGKAVKLDLPGVGVEIIPNHPIFDNN